MKQIPALRRALVGSDQNGGAAAGQMPEIERIARDKTSEVFPTDRLRASGASHDRQDSP